MADDAADALLAQMDAKFVEDMNAIDAQMESTIKDFLSQGAELRKEFSDTVLKKIEHPMEGLNVGNGSGNSGTGAEATQKPA